MGRHAHAKRTARFDFQHKSNATRECERAQQSESAWFDLNDPDFADSRLSFVAKERRSETDLCQNGGTRQTKRKDVAVMPPSDCAVIDGRLDLKYGASVRIDVNQRDGRLRRDKRITVLGRSINLNMRVEASAVTLVWS